MDITEDSNTNSKNKLTLGVHEEPMNSVASDHVVVSNHESNQLDQTPTGPAYSVFYHSGNQPSSSQIQTSGESVHRFNSKKNLAINKNKFDLINSPYSNASGVSAML